MSLLTRPCREITSLLLAAEDRTLGLRERVAIRLHLTVCDACTRFSAQMQLMRGALSHWKHYRDTDEP